MRSAAVSMTVIIDISHFFNGNKRLFVMCFGGVKRLSQFFSAIIFLFNVHTGLVYSCGRLFCIDMGEGGSQKV